MKMFILLKDQTKPEVKRHGWKSIQKHKRNIQSK